MSAAITSTPCDHCGHVRAIEYHESGTIKRVEYHGIEGIHTPQVERREDAPGGLWTVVHKNHPTYLHFSREAAENARKNLPAELGARVARIVFDGDA